MRITIVQSTLQWEAAEANRRRFFEKLQPLAGQTDVVVLPEMFTTGFSMNAKALAEPLDGPTLGWMRETAHQLGTAIAGSFICAENGHYRNRLLWVFPDGQFQLYDKKHLFALAGEHEHYTPGNEHAQIVWKGWRIRPLICYDLRFPEWARNSPGDEGYDLLIYAANWPSRRAHHWRSLLTARAIENQCYLAGVNIVGQDGNGHEYIGDSTIVDFSGQTLCHLAEQEGHFTAHLSIENLRAFRERLPFLKDM